MDPQSHLPPEKQLLWHLLVWKVGGGKKLSSIKVSQNEAHGILCVEFCQCKRDGLFLENLFLKRTGQFSLYPVISQD